jgi:hypothetical protein
MRFPFWLSGNLGFTQDNPHIVSAIGQERTRINPEPFGEA